MSSMYYSSYEVRDVILSDHSYSRRTAYGCNLKPTKTLFSPRQSFQTSDDVDITSVEPLPPLEYDSFKSLQLMDECERFVIFARVPRVEEASDDWEDKISKKLWSLDQLNLFKRVMKILHADRLARLALKGAWSEPARRRAHVDRSAQRFREAMAAVSWDAHLAQWLHGLLVDKLDMGYLAAYVDILQTLKFRIPTLVERLLAGAVYGKAPVVQQGMNLLLKRPWDPAVSTINTQKLGKLPGNAVIMLVPSSLKKHTQVTPRCNLWSTHLSNLATLITITPTAGTISSRMTPPAYLEQMVSVTKARMASVRVEYPGRPLVVVGWRSGAAVALQAAATEQVAAVVSLGLSSRTVEGPRGDPDDSIYSLTCPVLFVTGEHSSTARPEDLEEIRAKMLAPTGLVVVGSSDDCLRMGRRHKISLGVTQSLVDRAVLEAVGEFLADVLLQPATSPSADRHQAAAAGVQRKRRLSDSSVDDSEGSLKPPHSEPPSKQLRQALTVPFKAVNGNAAGASPVIIPKPPSRRGRKPGSLNKTSRQKMYKTLQTISPVKKTIEVGNSEGSKCSDVTLDVGSIASLSTTGPILRTGVPHSTGVTLTTPHGAMAPGTSVLQTFRIHGGRVSASSAPPGDVMPMRAFESTPISFGTSHLLVVGPNYTAVNGALRAADKERSGSSPIMTLSPMARLGSPRPPGRPSMFPGRPSTFPGRPSSFPVRAGPRFTIGSTSKMPTQRSVVVMSDKRQIITPSTQTQLKLTNALKTSPVKVLKALPAARLSIGKHLTPSASSPLQQKPIIVKSRAVKTNVDSDKKQMPLVIVKSRALEVQEEKHMLYLQRGEGKPDVPLMIVKNRAVAEEGEAEAIEPNKSLLVQDRSSKSLLLTERTPKHLVLSTGDELMVPERKPALPKYVLNYKKMDDEDGYIYKVID